MNIFVLDSNPVRAAYMLHPQHFGQTKPGAAWGCPKLALEGLQMLAVAYHRRGWGTIPKLSGEPYSPRCHPHHRCTRWVCDSYDHVAWLLEHIHAILRRHQEASGESSGICFSFWAAWKTFSQRADMWPADMPAPEWFAVADGIQGPHDRFKPADAVRLYREYYRARDLFTEYRALT